MTRVIFRPAPGFATRIERTAAAEAAAYAIASRVVRPAVEAVAPRGPGPRGGAYRGSITVVRENGLVAVISTDPFAHLVEWGSVNNPAYAPLRRGVRAAGLRLDDMSRI